PAAEVPALGPVGRQARRVRRLPAAAAGRERVQIDGRQPRAGAGAVRGDRAHRRRRWFWRPTRARPAGGAQRRAGGVHLGRIGARRLWRGVAGRSVAGRGGDRTAPRCDKIAAITVETVGWAKRSVPTAAERRIKNAWARRFAPLL